MSDKAWYLLGVGNRYLNKEKYEKAIETYEALISENPPKEILVRAYNDMGIAHAKIEEFEKANKFFKKAETIKEYSPNFGVELYNNIIKFFDFLDLGEKVIEYQNKKEKIKSAFNLFEFAA